MRHSVRCGEDVKERKGEAEGVVRELSGLSRALCGGEVLRGRGALYPTGLSSETGPEQCCPSSSEGKRWCIGSCTSPSGTCHTMHPQSFCHQKGHWAETKVNEKTHGQMTPMPIPSTSNREQGDTKHLVHQGEACHISHHITHSRSSKIICGVNQC